MESEARSTDVQPEREAKLLIMIGLATMHTVCRISFILCSVFIYLRMILRNGVLKSLQEYIFKDFKASKVSTYDFSTLCTMLPHHLIKTKLIDLIDRTFFREETLYF